MYIFGVYIHICMYVSVYVRTYEFEHLKFSNYVLRCMHARTYANAKIYVCMHVPMNSSI